ncbi:MAG: hypothetical protein NVSMB27_10160 [Ktedonobacteraceae bacterium]
MSDNGLAGQAECGYIGVYYCWLCDIDHQDMQAVPTYLAWVAALQADLSYD